MKIDLDFVEEVFYFKEVSSTNDVALENYRKKEFTLFIAENQYKGRGRENREWFSPPKQNLYFSFILKPCVNRKYFTSIPLYAAYAVFKTIKQYISPDKTINIKWPNDILVNKKKISGILIETKEDAVIAGVGINVNSKSFPVFEKNTPTSLFLETGKKFARKEILKTFLVNFKNCYEKFLEKKKLTEDILELINDALFLRNAYVEISFKDTLSKRGKIISVTPEGFLQLDTFTAVAGDVFKLKCL